MITQTIYLYLKYIGVKQIQMKACPPLSNALISNRMYFLCNKVFNKLLFSNDKVTRAMQSQTVNFYTVC